MNRRAAANADLAHCLALWLQGHKCTVQVLHVIPDIFEVHYTLRDDVKPQPPVRVDGTIKFPVGSQISVVQAFLREGM